jgi:hypothetical protein
VRRTVTSCEAAASLDPTGGILERPTALASAVAGDDSQGGIALFTSIAILTDRTVPSVSLAGCARSTRERGGRTGVVRWPLGKVRVGEHGMRAHGGVENRLSNRVRSV